MKCECCMDCYKIDCCDSICDFNCGKCNMNKNIILKEKETTKNLNEDNVCKVTIIAEGIEKTFEISEPLKGKDRLVKINGKWYVLRYS